MEIIKNMRCFKIKYFGATNTQGTRMKIYDCRNKVTKWLCFSSMFDRPIDQVLEYLRTRGIKVCFKAEFDNRVDVLLTDNFEVSLKWNEHKLKDLL